MLLSALDNKRLFVNTLRAEDVRVLEDGVPQQISSFERETDAPLSLVLLVDTSASQEKVLKQEQEAASAFIRSVLRPARDTAAVLSFTGLTRMEHPPTADASRLLAAVAGLQVRYTNKTPECQNLEAPAEVRLRCLTGVWDAVTISVREVLSKMPERTRRAVILLSDGDDTSSRVRLYQAAEIAVRNNTVVYSIGIRDKDFDFGEMRRDFLQSLSDQTGGRAFFPKRPSDLASVFAQIEQELRSQYLITYTPTNRARDGSFRKLQIEADRPRAPQTENPPPLPAGLLRAKLGRARYRPDAGGPTLRLRGRCVIFARGGLQQVVVDKGKAGVYKAECSLSDALQTPHKYAYTANQIDMQSSAVEQVVAFYQILFGQIFSAPFREQISNPLERNAVTRLVGELADAASQSLTLFFANRRLKSEDVAEILESLSELGRLLKLEDVAQPGVPPETVIKKRLGALPRPEGSGEAGFDVVYRLALQSVLENLLLIGPVLSKWQKFNFSRTYEPPRRIIEHLNRNIAGLGAEQAAGEGTQDELYELDHRNYLLQRFERVEAGTVQMTTNMVDLQALFVMPRVQPRPQRQRPDDGEAIDLAEIMNLAAARKFFGGVAEPDVEAKPPKKGDTGTPAFEQVERHPRTVIVGVPGSGKSTFLEWLQLSVAVARATLVAGEGQAIPLLLRVRELDAKRLPAGAGLIEAATGSEDRAALMPDGWLDRQMKQGRVLFMLDGLDETDPKTRDKYLLPWLAKLCEEYPDCRYLVSSRPAGYPPGTLRKLKFAECNLLDFNEPEITEYTKNWCTAIRLARGENEKEARRKGAAEGESIVKGFKSHPYIKNLARNPLMLSAVCLVNYFEDGKLPEDRARLYRLCVEGLLHHWDSRRGIHSVFTLDEKLRACRQVAIAMQADDRAEYEAAKVLKIFAKVLADRDRAKALLEHIRYRTGLLIERRAGIFAFAHLTFQEYLAACAVHEGNYRNIDAEQLAREHADARWNEVIALYCGIAPTRDTHHMLEYLIGQKDTGAIAEVLAEAYLSSGAEIGRDQKLRKKVIERIAIAPIPNLPGVLERFPEKEVAPIANLSIGKLKSSNRLSQALLWLDNHPGFLNEAILMNRLQSSQKLSQPQASELMYLLHRLGSNKLLTRITAYPVLYKGIEMELDPVGLNSVAGMVLLGLPSRKIRTPRHIIDMVLLHTLQALLHSKQVKLPFNFEELIKKQTRTALPKDDKVRRQLAFIVRQLAIKLGKYESSDPLNTWADLLEGAPTEDKRRRSTAKTKSNQLTNNSAKSSKAESINDE